MQRTDFSNWDCSLARVSHIIGDGWSPLIIRDIANGIEIFSDLQEGLSISKNTLTQRLTSLIDHKILERKLYQKHPPRYRYLLTERGKELVVALLALSAWSDKWIFDGNPPYRVRHLACDTLSTAKVVCDHCNDPIEFDDIETG